MKATYEDIFIIRMEQIITLTEVDERIKEFYIGNTESGDYLGSDDINVKPKKLRNNGYVGSVEDMKKSLESLFKRS